MAYSDIKDPSAHFQTALYTGTGSAHSIGNDGNSDLKPDWVWIKKRSASGNHSVFDSTRGAYKELITNGTNAEATDVQLLTQFDTDGFTVGTNGGVNGSGATFVAWQWKANGGTTVSNTSGSTTTTVQANQDAGFSILTWTGNGSATTLGHGLGVEPEVIIQKARGTTSNWAVYHKDAGPRVSQASYNVATYLNLTDATGLASNSWGTAASDINSNTFYLKHWFNYNTTNLAYCFASKQGYSKFGSYVGNGNADGPFIYTGFKPAFVLIKRAESADNWFLYDTKRSPFNEADEYIRANIDNAEGSNNFQIDMLSNGFKTRNSGTFIGALNASGGSYIYMAFAENPFVAGGVPTTAR